MFALRLSLLCTLALGYSIDDENPLRIFSGEATSYFGYSIVSYSSGNDSIVIVGAPRANSSYSPGVFEPGAVYRCSVAENSCDEWRVDFGPGQSVPGLSRFEEQAKDRSWLGASMALHRRSDFADARVAICAPRWKKVSRRTAARRSYMNGMCLSRGVGDEPAGRRYFPLSGQESQTVEIDGKHFYDHGMAEAGFSLHWPDSSPARFAIGAPGAAVSTGSSLLLSEERMANPADPSDADSFRALVPDFVNDGRFDRVDRFYFGYSMTSGQFYEPGVVDYATGAPRGSRTRGKVFIYQFPPGNSYWDNKLMIKDVLEGEQYGEYFGSALAACDVNGDGRDDLVIGAPLWSKLSDEGRVYAYVSSRSRDELRPSFEVQRLTAGSESRSAARFGSVVSCLGDLELDGYADVAVAAPYEDERRGAVYVFRGGAEGLSSRYSQRIRAVGPPSLLRGFGQAIAYDAETNRLAVGAYLSGHLVVLAQRAVLVVEAQLRVSQDDFRLSTNQTLLPLQVCARYDGRLRHTPDAIDAYFTLQVDKSHQRTFIYDKVAYGDTYKFLDTLTRGRNKCTTIKTYIKKNLQNVIDPIEVKATVALPDSSCRGCPVVDPKSSRSVAELKLFFLLDCGDDGICHSDLGVSSLTSPDFPVDPDNGEGRFVVGSRSSVGLSLRIENRGEPAYGARAHVYVPRPIGLARIPPECSEQPRQQVNETLMELVCGIGNPLRYNYTLFLELDMSAVVFYTNFSHEIAVKLSTQSEEKDLSDNTRSLLILYDADADLAIVAGKSYNESYALDEQDLSAKNSYAKHRFDHVYEIQNFGLTPIEEADLTLKVPTHWKSSEIAKIRHVQGSAKERKIRCKYIAEAEDSDSIVLPSSETLAVSSATDVYRTFSVSCDHENVACQTFLCKLGPFIKSHSVARLTVTIDLELSKDIASEIKAKDALVFVSEAFIKTGYSNVTTFDSATRKTNFKQISTTFFCHRPATQLLPLWIIVLLSVLLGIVLIVVSTVLLVKLGFFNRKTKDDLDTLKSTEELHRGSEKL